MSVTVEDGDPERETLTSGDIVPDEDRSFVGEELIVFSTDADIDDEKEVAGVVEMVEDDSSVRDDDPETDNQGVLVAVDEGSEEPVGPDFDSDTSEDSEYEIFSENVWNFTFIHAHPSPTLGTALNHFPKRGLDGPYITTSVAPTVVFGSPLSKLQYRVQDPVLVSGPSKNGAPFPPWRLPSGPPTHR